MAESKETSSGYRLGVDVGGTFTDVCVVTPQGSLVQAKSPSTSPDQSVGVKHAIDKAREILKRDYKWEGKFDFIHHGTTVATNAILEGKGNKSALVVTAGHKDVLNLRRSQIPGALGAWLTWETPKPVIPLELTIDAPERVSIEGEIVTPLDEDALRKNLARLKGENPEVITVSLINSFANNAHEIEVRRILNEEFPNASVVISSEVLPEVGEYERTVTTAANAIVKPTMQRYLSHLTDILHDDSDIIRILKSDGGLTNLGVAGEYPVHLLMSGPAGGVRGITHAVSGKYPNLITLDVGGTSTDCALISNGIPTLRRETKIGSLSVKAPSIDVHTVGAGGGSIAQYNPVTGNLRVGPESAGAVPGPACYGRGGTQPTVTDANLVLGYLPESLLGGEFKLDVALATKAVSNLATQMGISVDEAAQGIINLANEAMYGAIRTVSVEQGYDPKDFSLVVFGGGGPMHANAVGELLGSWPVIVPPAPGILCAQGDAVTKQSHEKTASYIKILSTLDLEGFRDQFGELIKDCQDKIVASDITGTIKDTLKSTLQVDLRYMGQSQEITVDLDESLLPGELSKIQESLREKFETEHNRQFTFIMSQHPIELIRLRSIVSDDSPDVELKSLGSSRSEVQAPESAILFKRSVYYNKERLEATFWDRKAISIPGVKIHGPSVISEMDSNTLVLPGYVATIDEMGNIVITPNEESKSTEPQKSLTREEAKQKIVDSPIIPNLISSALGAIKLEMDALMLRVSMSPAIREQQDEFNVLTRADGEMLVGQFGSFITDFLKAWTGPVEEGDVFITNDVYEMRGAVSHFNDVIILVPVFYQGHLVGWAANFGHLTDVQGKTPGSLSIDATTVFEDGFQIPAIKLFSKGVINQDLMTVMCRNSRAPDWFRSDIMALLAACNMASSRLQELCDRFGEEVFMAATDVLLERNKNAVAKMIDTVIPDKKAEFIDFIDDDGHGTGPFAIKCTMEKRNGKLFFDWSGSSPQSTYSINYMLSANMFKMYIIYYLLVVLDPYTWVNSGANDLIEVYIPEGSILKPVRPAAVSCRTHLLGRVFDVIQAVLGQVIPEHRAAAGFSDSPHLYYSGFKPSGEFFLLYQIGFGGVPARPAGDGPDCHCLFPSIKSIPTESIELYFPLRIEVNEALADSGGAGHFRGGNAQRTLYKFLCAGEVSVHDDRALTVPWGRDGGYPGMRSYKALIQYSKDAKNPPRVPLPSKGDKVWVEKEDVLEWVTWGGGGLGDPLTRPVEAVASDVRRRLVTVAGAETNYGVVMDPETLSVVAERTNALRAEMTATRSQDKQTSIYNRGGTLEELAVSYTKDTGLPAPSPQWMKDPYGPHAGLDYVKDWYKTMREKGGWDL